MKSKIPIKKKCEWCGKDFIAYKVTTQLYTVINTNTHGVTTAI